MCYFEIVDKISMTKMESKARIDDIIFKVANSGNNNHIVKSSWLFNFFSGLYIPDTVFYSFQV